MGTLNDIITGVQTFVKTGKNVGSALYKNIEPAFSKNGSLASKASEGTLQFPVIMSSSIDIETAQMVTKALERNYATFAQIVFSMSPTLKYHDDVNATEYIKKFHQNQPNLFELVFTKENSIDYSMLKNDRFEILGAVYETSTQKITASNKEQLIDLMEHVRTDILNNKYVPKDTTIYNFSDSSLNHKYNSPVKEDLTETKFNYQVEKDTKDFAYRANKDMSEFKYRAAQDTIKNRSVELSKNILQDNDVKKSNELVATTLHLRVRLVSQDGKSDMGTMDFVVGIKGIMHPVKSNEMITNVVAACRNNDKVFNFLRWTTGEISFFKDLLFNIKTVKTDVASRSMGASPWWIAMKNRKSLSGIKKGILPNATIVMSAEEVEYIKTEFGFDLMNEIFVKKIMSEYYLLGFVIVDNSTQVVYFKFDGENSFQTVTFSGLEKANVNSERTFREMLKTMNRV